MNDPKKENLLNLALDTEPAEREKSLNLNVGYDEEEKTWELIVKYQGDLSGLRSAGIRVTELLNAYAVLKVPEALVDAVAKLPQITYVEKPKRLFFAAEQGKTASCMTAVQNERFSLFGQGVLVACLDSGVDISHPDFRNEDGSSRILYLWDQTRPGDPPAGYELGSEYTKEQLDALLRQAEQPGGSKELLPGRDISGHGTAVLGIAAGNGRGSGGRFRGVATKSPLLAVKLGTPGERSFPKTAELIQATDYAVRKSLELELPMALNISFGNTYGAHDGTSLLETYLSDAADLGRTVFCVGTGNEGFGNGHTEGRLRAGVETLVEFAVGEYELALNIQLWKSYTDEFDIYLSDPDGVSTGPLSEEKEDQSYILGGQTILVYYGEPTPYSVNQEIYLDFIPRGTFLRSGIWSIRLVPKRILEGIYRMWMPSQAVLNGGTRFLRPVETTTLTIPSTAAKVIAVGAYDSRTRSYADFSGRGGGPGKQARNPDLAAPGAAVTAPAAGGGYGSFTGTSFATPFVTGAAALLMQWGITEGRDPYLYGEKVKACLQKGARPLPGFEEYPNPQVGYGTLCLKDSLP